MSGLLTYAKTGDTNLDSSFNNPDSFCIETLLSEVLFNLATDQDDIDAENEFHISSENLEEEGGGRQCLKKNYKNNAKISGDEPIYHGHSMSAFSSFFCTALRRMGFQEVNYKIY